MAKDTVHFDGTMVAGGLGYGVDEILASPAPAAMSTGVDAIDEITGGIQPGALWAIDGPAGIGVSDLALTLALGAARTEPVILANGHVASRSLAVRIRKAATGSTDGLKIASWLPLPIAGRESLSTECQRAGLVVLDTLDEMWRPPGVTLDADAALAGTRLLREAARTVGTAVLVTARLPAYDEGQPRYRTWLSDVLDDVADVRISLSLNLASGLVTSRIRTRSDGAVHHRALARRPRNAPPR